MSVQLLWYNPNRQEYQFGDYTDYKEIIYRSEDSRNFVVMEKFVNLSESVKSKIATRIEIFNRYRRTSHLSIA